jgi:hypothetical protein
MLVAASLLLLFVWPRAEAQTVSACGKTYRSGQCIWFSTTDQGDAYVLADTSSITAPGLYHIQGTVTHGVTSCDPSPVALLTAVTATPCALDSLGCGKLMTVESEFGPCTVWEALSGESRYVVDFQGFTAGDTVRAWGVPCSGCGINWTCPIWAVDLLQVRLAACDDTLNPASESSWGSVKRRYIH